MLMQKTCAGFVGFNRFMAFLEEVTGEEFIVFLHKIMESVVIEIIAQAGNSPDWGTGQAIPESVLHRTQRLLRELGRIGGQSEDAADFLAGRRGCLHLQSILTAGIGAVNQCGLCACAEGDHVMRILKEYGDVVERSAMAAGGGRQSKAEGARQLQILRCVGLLLRLTGSFAPRYVPQVMVLLSRSLRPDLVEAVKLQSLEGWHTLVDALAAHGTSVLASIMNQVFGYRKGPVSHPARFRNTERQGRANLAGRGRAAGAPSGGRCGDGRRCSGARGPNGAAR